MPAAEPHLLALAQLDVRALLVEESEPDGLAQHAARVSKDDVDALLPAGRGERLPGEGVPLHRADEFDLPALERYWADNFTNVDHQTLIAYKQRIDDLMAGTAATFGTAQDSASPVAAE